MRKEKDAKTLFDQVVYSLILSQIRTLGRRFWLQNGLVCHLVLSGLNVVG